MGVLEAEGVVGEAELVRPGPRAGHSPGGPRPHAWGRSQGQARPGTAEHSRRRRHVGRRVPLPGEGPRLRDPRRRTGVGRRRRHRPPAHRAVPRVAGVVLRTGRGLGRPQAGRRAGKPGGEGGRHLPGPQVRRASGGGVVEPRASRAGEDRPAGQGRLLRLQHPAGCRRRRGGRRGPS